VYSISTRNVTLAPGRSLVDIGGDIFEMLIDDSVVEAVPGADCDRAISVDSGKR
jgi:hypothetical protein